MPGFKDSTPHDPQLLARIARPRFLRAIPSLVVLTTAMAWAAAASAGGLEFDGAARSGAETRSRTSSVQGAQADALAGLKASIQARNTGDIAMEAVDD